MQTDTAVKWFMDLPFEKRIEISDRYYPEYAEDNLDLNDEEIVHIFLSEHPTETETKKEAGALSTGEGFTGGQWYCKDALQTDNKDVWESSVFIGGAEFVSVYGNTVKECEANARLITNAPDMYRVLKKIAFISDNEDKEYPAEIVKKQVYEEAKAILTKIDNQ